MWRHLTFITRIKPKALTVATQINACTCKVQLKGKHTMHTFITATLLRGTHRTHIGFLVCKMCCQSTDHRRVYRICSNISPGFYFFPGSGDPVSKRDRPLFGTSVYKISASIHTTRNNRNDRTNLKDGSFLGCFSHLHSSETLKRQAYR